jgi:putative transposase
VACPPKRYPQVIRVEQAKKLKELEKENARLKKLVADITLDNAILKEVAEGDF